MNTFSSNSKIFDRSTESIETWLAEWLANKLKIEVEAIDTRKSLVQYGIDSLTSFRLTDELGNWLKRPLPLTLVWNSPSILAIAQDLAQDVDASVSAHESSLVPIQTGGSKQPLFCVINHPGFFDLARLLGLDQPFYGLTLPPPDEIQNPYTAIEDMAANSINEILAVQPQGPYLLGGHCFGGIVAFEMAQQLQAQGHEVSLLALFEPSTTFNTNIMPSNVSRFVYHLRKLWQLDRASKLTYIFEKVKNIKTYMVSKARVMYNQRAKQAYKARQLLNSSYVLQPYQGRIALFLSINTYLLLSRVQNPRLAWSKLADGRLEAYEVPGDHASLLNEPQVQVLAEKLKFCLDRAQANLDDNHQHIGLIEQV